MCVGVVEFFYVYVFVGDCFDDVWFGDEYLVGFVDYDDEVC